MIIRENGIVVGKIDDETLALVEAESERLEALVNDMRANGITFTTAGEEPEDVGEEMPASVDGSITLPYTAENRVPIIRELENFGFDVQTS